MTVFDPGPPPDLADLFAALPDYPAEHRALFWYDWGPVFYRGRLDRSARFLGIASDPGPTERIAGRTLVGDAGQRVQGFLRKLGLDHSYVLVNAFAYAVHPSAGSQARTLLSDPAHLGWRNRMLDAVAGPDLEVIVAFGENAQAALHQWASAPPHVPAFSVPHPSSHDTAALLDQWRTAVAAIREVVTPDPGGDPGEPNYGTTFEEHDYARIPAADLPFGLPGWVGDDSRGRTATPPHRNSVMRSPQDPDHTLVWQAPVSD